MGTFHDWVLPFLVAFIILAIIVCIVVIPALIWKWIKIHLSGNPGIVSKIYRPGQIVKVMRSFELVRGHWCLVISDPKNRVRIVHALDLNNEVKPGHYKYEVIKIINFGTKVISVKQTLLPISDAHAVSQVRLAS